MERIINTYDQLRIAVKLGIIPEKKAVAVSYHPSPAGRAGWSQCNKSKVYSPFFKTDPGAHWQDYGSKSFVGNRARSFEEAKAWASKEYGITEWKPNRMRDHVPAEVQKLLPIPKGD